MGCGSVDIFLLKKYNFQKRKRGEKVKFIHTADIHLGSALNKFPKEIADARKAELRDTFKRLVDYAARERVRAVILAGDVFDSDAPFKKDKDFFYSVVKSAPQVDFLYLRGNHDSASVYTGETLPNLKTFAETWTVYEYAEGEERVRIAGAELSATNATSVYSSLDLPKEGKNIVALHGQIGGAGKDGVDLKRLRGKNIDYLALGHIHRPEEGKFDDRGEYAYCGCLEGRGFDEAGEHGFLLLDTSGEKIARTFVPFAARTVVEADADITGVKDAYGAYRRVKELVSFQKKDIYRVNLVGETDLEAESYAGDVSQYLKQDCYFADVKDKTVKKLDFHAYDNDRSLRGEFVRQVYESDLTEEEKKRVVAYGLRALEGRELDV